MSLLKAQVKRDLLKRDFLDRLDVLDREVRRLKIGAVEGSQVAGALLPGMAYVGDKPMISADAAGNLSLGSDLDQPSGTHLSIFGNDGTYNSETVGAGDLLIGDNSASKANLFWDKSAGQLKIRGGTTTEVYIDTSGSLVAGGGNVEINSDGVTLYAASAYGTGSSRLDIDIAKTFGSGTLGFLEGYYTTNGMASAYMRMYLNQNPVAGKNPKVELVSDENYVGTYVTLSADTVNANGDLSINGSVISSTPIWGSWSRATDTAIASGATYYTTWETEITDTDGMWSSGTNITVKTAGVYLIMGEFEWANGGDATSRQAIIYHNGSAVGQHRCAAVNGPATIQPVHAIRNASVNDYFRLAGRHLRGSNLNMQNARFWVAKLI